MFCQLSSKVSERLFNKLKPTGSQPPRLYGLAKVHKDNYPMRPVVSMPGSLNQKIATVMAHWLSGMPECNINSSNKLISSDLKNYKLKENQCMLSCDIVSLYPNVLVKEAIDFLTSN